MLLAAVALSAGLAGCGKKDDSVDQAETRYCTATDEVQAAFSRFAHMDPDVTSAADVRSARDALADALGHLEDAATDVASARNKVGDDPVTAFTKRLENVDQDASITEAAAEMARAGGDFLGDVKDYVGDLDCKHR
jgi:hypothetical protein